MILRSHSTFILSLQISSVRFSLLTVFRTSSAVIPNFIFLKPSGSLYIWLWLVRIERELFAPKQIAMSTRRQTPRNALIISVFGAELGFILYLPTFQFPLDEDKLRCVGALLARV